MSKNVNFISFKRERRMQKILRFSDTFLRRLWLSLLFMSKNSLCYSKAEIHTKLLCACFSKKKKKKSILNKVWFMRAFWNKLHDILLSFDWAFRTSYLLQFIYLLHLLYHLQNIIGVGWFIPCNIFIVIAEILIL